MVSKWCSPLVRSRLVNITTYYNDLVRTITLDSLMLYLFGCQGDKLTNTNVTTKTIYANKWLERNTHNITKWLTNQNTTLNSTRTANNKPLSGHYKTIKKEAVSFCVFNSYFIEAWLFCIQTIVLYWLTQKYNLSYTKCHVSWWSLLSWWWSLNYTKL